MRPGVALGLAGAGAVVLLALVGMTALTLRNAGLLGSAPAASTTQAAPTTTATSAATAASAVLAPTVPAAPSEARGANDSVATATPTSSPPTPAPIPTPVTPAAARFVVAGAGVEGVNLREQPSISASRIRTLHDGAEVEAAGEERDEDGRRWRHVRDLADGQAGWVAAEFLRDQTRGAGSSDDPLAAYQARLAEILRDVRSAASELRTQLGRLDASPALAADPSWQAAGLPPLSALEARGKELQAYESVPPSAAELHREIDTLGSEIVGIHGQLLGALERRNEAEARSAVQRLTALGPKLDRIEAALHELEPSPDDAPELAAAAPTETPPPAMPTPPPPPAPSTSTPTAQPTAPPTVQVAPPTAPLVAPTVQATPRPAPPKPALPPTPPPAAPAAPAPKPSTGRSAPRGFECPPTHPIKGNHSSSGEWIYHPPGGQFYTRTRPEECFATPADAVRAGYRASLR